MTLTGTDPVTDIPGLGPGTAERLRGGIELVRDFIVDKYVDGLPSKKSEASQAIRRANIDPFEEYTQQHIQLAKFSCAHGAKFFRDDGSKILDLQPAIAAGPYPTWGLLGRRDWTPLPAGDDLSVQPTSLVPAHYRTAGDTYKPVYIVTTANRIDDPNTVVHNPHPEDIDTVVPAREVDFLAEIFDSTAEELLTTMRYEQDAPLHFRDPQTGMSAMVPTATSPNRADRANEWPQATRADADTAIYTLNRN